MSGNKASLRELPRTLRTSGARRVMQTGPWSLTDRRWASKKERLYKYRCLQTKNPGFLRTVPTYQQSRTVFLSPPWRLRPPCLVLPSCNRPNKYKKHEHVIRAIYGCVYFRRPIRNDRLSRVKACNRHGSAAVVEPSRHGLRVHPHRRTRGRFRPLRTCSTRTRPNTLTSYHSSDRQVQTFLSEFYKLISKHRSMSPTTSRLIKRDL